MFWRFNSFQEINYCWFNYQPHLKTENIFKSHPSKMVYAIISTCPAGFGSADVHQIQKQKERLGKTDGEEKQLLEAEIRDEEEKLKIEESIMDFEKRIDPVLMSMYSLFRIDDSRITDPKQWPPYSKRDSLFMTNMGVALALTWI